MNLHAITLRKGLSSELEEEQSTSTRSPELKENVTSGPLTFREKELKNQQTKKRLHSKFVSKGQLEPPE